MEYCQFENVIQTFAKGNDSPFGLIDNLWYVISPFDAINYAIDFITPQYLDRLSVIIDKVAMILILMTKRQPRLILYFIKNIIRSIAIMLKKGYS